MSAVDGLVWNEEVAGSIPAIPTNFNAPVSQLAEEIDLESIKCGFESDWGHQIINQTQASSIALETSGYTRYRITNYEYVADWIQKILLNHKNRWEDITGTDIFTNW